VDLKPSSEERVSGDAFGGGKEVQANELVKMSWRIRASLALKKYPAAAILVILVIVFAKTSPSFLTQSDWLSTSVYASSILPFALGELLVMLTAGIDLSLTGIAAFSGMATALILSGNSSASSYIFVIGASIVCVLIGFAIGIVNGLLISKLKLSPFIVTLGMLEILTGGVDLLHGGLSVEVVSQPLITFGTGTLFGWMPIVVLVTIILAIAVWIMLSRTRFGLRTYAIGSNPEAVRRLGVPSNRVITILYGLAGALGGVAGLSLISRFGEATTAVDTSTELIAIAAIVIGGTSLFGGVGSVGGSVLGVAVLSILLPGLVLSGLADFWQTVATGVVIIGAISMQAVRDEKMQTVAQLRKRVLEKIRREGSKVGGGYEQE